MQKTAPVKGPHGANASPAVKFHGWLKTAGTPARSDPSRGQRLAPPAAAPPKAADAPEPAEPAVRGSTAGQRRAGEAPQPEHRLAPPPPRPLRGRPSPRRRGQADKAAWVPVRWAATRAFGPVPQAGVTLARLVLPAAGLSPPVPAGPTRSWEGESCSLCAAPPGTAAWAGGRPLQAAARGAERAPQAGPTRRLPCASPGLPLWSLAPALPVLALLVLRQFRKPQFARKFVFRKQDKTKTTLRQGLNSSGGLHVTLAIAFWKINRLLAKTRALLRLQGRVSAEGQAGRGVRRIVTEHHTDNSTVGMRSPQCEVRGPEGCAHPSPQVPGSPDRAAGPSRPPHRCAGPRLSRQSSRPFGGTALSCWLGKPELCCASSELSGFSVRHSRRKSLPNEQPYCGSWVTPHRSVNPHRAPLEDRAAPSQTRASSITNKPNYLYKQTHVQCFWQRNLINIPE